MSGKKCPVCGGRAARIVYGLPDTSLFEKARRGEVALGGCVVGLYPGGDPNRSCERCGASWISKRVTGRFQRFLAPAAGARAIDGTPRLESWDANTSSSQIALAPYLDDVQRLLGPIPDRPLSLELRVGLPELTLQGGGHDLDNYLFPLVRSLGPSRFVSAWASKAPGSESTIAVAPAVEDETPPTEWSFAALASEKSATTTEWKHDLAAQVPFLEADDPLEVQLSFRASPKRNWTMLWKPAIDALGGILGIDNPLRPYHPRDDRIVRLGLHRTDDDALGWRVEIGVWWRPAPTEGGIW